MYKVIKTFINWLFSLFLMKNTTKKTNVNKKKEDDMGGFINGDKLAGAYQNGDKLAGAYQNGDKIPFTTNTIVVGFETRNQYWLNDGSTKTTGVSGNHGVGYAAAFAISAIGTTTGFRIYKTPVGGASVLIYTDTAHKTNLTGNRVAATKDGGLIVCSGINCIYYSTDSGETWTKMSTPVNLSYMSSGFDGFIPMGSGTAEYVLDQATLSLTNTANGYTSAYLYYLGVGDSGQLYSGVNSSGVWYIKNKTGAVVKTLFTGLNAQPCICYGGTKIIYTTATTAMIADWNPSTLTATNAVAINLSGQSMPVRSNPDVPILYLQASSGNIFYVPKDNTGIYAGSEPMAYNTFKPYTVNSRRRYLISNTAPRKIYLIEDKDDVPAESVFFTAASSSALTTSYQLCLPMYED